MKYLTMACAAISVVGVLGTHQAAAQGNPGYFKLQTMFQEADNKCFEGNRFAADATLQGGAFMDDCQNVSGQMWTAVPEGNGFFRLKTQFQGDNKCLEGNRFAPDATLKGAAFMDDCQNVSGQLWKAVGAELVNGVPQLAGQPAPQQPAGQIVVQQPVPQQPVPQQTTIQLPANQYVITLPANQYVIHQNGGQQLITLPAGPYVIQQPGGQIVIYLPAGQYVIQLAGAPAPVVIAPPVVSNQPPQMPSSMIIVNQLSAPPSIRLAPQDRVTLVQFLQRPDLRRAAPSIEIQSINFDTASSLIRPDQFAKVQQIAQALATILNSDPAARFLIEGHTDAVGSDTSNLLLSQQRSEALRYALIANFGTPQHALFTAGFGEQDLLIPTQQAEWGNRRVTLRRIDQFLRP